MSMRYNCAFLAAGFALAISAQTASARVLQVGTCTPANPYFTTIQSAVNAAFTGDTVAICPGTYPEQVNIPRGMTLTHVTGVSGTITVAVPAGGVVQNAASLDTNFPIAAQILAAPTSAATINIRYLVVDGTGNNDMSCGLDLMGIYYQNAGGTITHNIVQNQMLPPGYEGCQDGQGIFVENAAAGTGKVTITHNTVSNFDKNGITVHLGAANASIAANTVTGIGPTTLIAQNGIEVAYGATAAITGNTVSNLIYSPSTVGASGILLYDTQTGSYLATPVVEHNTVTSAQYGVVLDAVNGTSVSPVTIGSNSISNAQFAGVGLYSDNTFSPPLNDDYIDVVSNTINNTNPYDGIDACSDNNTIKQNRVLNSTTESAIHLDGLCFEPDGSTTGINNTVSGNRMQVDCVGILSGPVQGLNTIGTNSYTNVTNPIIYGQDSFSCGPHRFRAAGSASERRLGAPQPHRH